MALIYVVEDNNILLNDTVQWVNHSGHLCHGANDGSSFDNLMAEEVADLVVLDWMLPDEDGLAIAQRLRSNNGSKDIGIIFLTARSDVNDRITGHGVADAYLTKPVNYEELSAVINSTLRRIKSGSNNGDSSSWQLSTRNQLITPPNKNPISLTWRESNVLFLLYQNSSRYVTAQEIVKAIEQDWLDFDKSRLEMLISRLRTKLRTESDVDSNPIRAYRNKGYQLMLTIKVVDS